MRRKLVPGLESAFASEHDDRFDLIRGHSKQFPQTLSVFIVLEQRILKLLAMPAMNFLRPLPILFATEDPSLVVLGLDNKHTKGRNNDVVDLRRATLAIRNRHVVDHAIDIFRQEKRKPQAHDHLAEPSLRG